MAGTSRDESEVVAVIERYIEGYVNADLSVLRGAFADDAVMNGYVGDRLVAGTPEPFFRQVGSNPPLKSPGTGPAPDPGPNPAYDIEHLSITNNAASAVLRETGFGPHDFTDYMHLLKRDGVWKIVSKTFSTR